MCYCWSLVHAVVFILLLFPSEGLGRSGATYCDACNHLPLCPASLLKHVRVCMRCVMFDVCCLSPVFPTTVKCVSLWKGQEQANECCYKEEYYTKFQDLLGLI